MTKKLPTITLTTRGAKRLTKHVGENVEIRLPKQVKGIRKIHGKLEAAKETGNGGVVGALYVQTGQGARAKKGKIWLIVKRHYIGNDDAEIAKKITPAVFAWTDIGEQDLRRNKDGSILRTAVQWAIPDAHMRNGPESASETIKYAIHRAAMARILPVALNIEDRRVSDVKLSNGAHLAPHDATIEEEYSLNKDLELQELVQYAKEKDVHDVVPTTLADGLEAIHREVEDLGERDKAKIQELAKKLRAGTYDDFEIDLAYTYVTEHLAKTSGFWQYIAGEKKKELLWLRRAVGNLSKTRAMANMLRTIRLLESSRIKDWQTKLRMLAELERNESSLRTIALKKLLKNRK